MVLADYSDMQRPRKTSLDDIAGRRTGSYVGVSEVRHFFPLLIHGVGQLGRARFWLSAFCEIQILAALT